MELAIRKGKIQDIEAILEIIEDARELFKLTGSPQWQDGYPNHGSFMKDIRNDSLYVCIHNEKVIGTMSIISHDSNYDYIEGEWLTSGPYIAIHRFAVKEEYRRKGVATFMMKYAEENFKAGSIRIDTHQKNIAMQRFLLSNGFVYCGIIFLNLKTDRERLAYEKIIR